MSEALILTELRGEGARRTALITLNRPKQLNALNDALMDQLGAALLAFDADDGVGNVTGDAIDRVKRGLGPERDFEGAYATSHQCTRQRDRLACVVDHDNGDDRPKPQEVFNGHCTGSAA